MNWQDFTNEVTCATFDIADDKIRIYSGRVTEELFEILRKLGFQRAYQQGCFFAVWTPGRWDAAVGLCGEVDDESTTPEERAEAKAERLEGYSANAGKRAAQAHKTADDISQRFELGQPIILNHHSTARSLRDRDRIDANMTKAVENWKREEYWQDRAQSVMSHAERRERPDVILRRIKKLEAEIRKYQRDSTPSYDLLYWSKRKFFEEKLGHTDVRDIPTPEEEELIAAYVEKVKIDTKTYCDRWIEHLTLRLAYERTLYESVEGPKPTTLADQLKIGCYVKTRYGWEGPVSRINKGRDKQVSSVSVPSGYSWSSKVEIDRIVEVKND